MWSVLPTFAKPLGHDCAWRSDIANVIGNLFGLGVDALISLLEAIGFGVCAVLSFFGIPCPFSASTANNLATVSVPPSNELHGGTAAARIPNRVAKRRTAPA